MGVVQCKGGRSVSFSKCPFFQECKKSHSEVHTAACQEDACDDKADGWRCKHDHLVRCASQQTTDVVMWASLPLVCEHAFWDGLCARPGHRFLHLVSVCFLFLHGLHVARALLAAFSIPERQLKVGN